MPFDPHEIAALIGPDGPLLKRFEGFEVREAQGEMLLTVCQAYLEETTALIEAGTGTGKSLAYLLPAALFALECGEATLISTHTIALQEQLLQKDIPFLKETLGLELKAVLIKGMHNYLCLRRLADTAQEKRLLGEREQKEIEQFEEWAEQTEDGSRSDLPFAPSNECWDRVSAEAESCNHVRCPHYEKCFFFKARKRAKDAHLLIVNHHLLCADLAARHESDTYSDAVILPPYQRLILDEAHHLEDVATEYFAKRVSRLGLIRQLGRLLSDRGTGKLKTLNRRVCEIDASSPLLGSLELDLPSEKRRVVDLIEELFDTMARFVKENSSDEKIRFRQHHLLHSLWGEKVQPLAQKLIEEGQKFIHSLLHLASEVEDDASLKKSCAGILTDIRGIVSRLENALEALRDFIFSDEQPEKVRWIEGTAPYLHLITAELNIAPLLSASLFSPFHSVVLTSATLTTERHFQFIRNRLGIGEAIERIYDSPFAFQDQALLAVPGDLPLPNHADFLNKASEMIWKIVETSRGNAFVLFTSYQMLRACAEKLEERFRQKNYLLLCQGEESRHALLARFRETNFSVLFGTDSFWEGVDVAGEALRCVVIVKLPFKVPSDPLFQARSEAIAQAGGSPFTDYSLPQAVVKFKQGFGRLIRKNDDRGCVICLDPRLTKKSYGKAFLESLPSCPTHFGKEEEILTSLKTFFYKNQNDSK